MTLFNNWMFIVSIALFILSAILQLGYKKSGWAIGTLFLSAFFVRLFMAHLDPFLHDWDEKFHALVARNMMGQPFKPMLKPDSVFIQDVHAWCCNHIWLHKQPLFMWQMALSMKVFGVSEFAIRYPSVLMGALMIPLLYRIAILLTKDGSVAFFAAALFCFSFYHLELISGNKVTDHNDVIYGFYVLASIWAYMEYLNKASLKWVLLIGVFAGAAVLNKWLTGLLVFGGWGINILLSIKKEGWCKQVIHLLLSLAVCLVVFVPWQVYIINTFPELAAHEYAFNRKHVFEVVEGHGGGNSFYWDRLVEYYGAYIWVVVVAAFFYFITKVRYSLKMKIVLLASLLAIFIFFSFMVKTKMSSFFFVVMPIGLIFLSILVNDVIARFRYRNIILAIVLGFGIYYSFNKDEIVKSHDLDDAYRNDKIANTEIYKSLYDIMPDSITHVVNVKVFQDVELMFYNPGVTAYHYGLPEDVWAMFAQKKIKVAAFRSREGYMLDANTYKYKGIYIIEETLK